jgi:pre-mRNA-splicing helicase BRR2
MRYIASQVEDKIRIVALSTSLAIVLFLFNFPTSHGLFNFPPGVRPVPLEIHIQGVDIANFEVRMQAMKKPTFTAIVQHTKNGKPALVFVPTRKHVQLTAVDLMTCSVVEGGGEKPFLLQTPEEIEPFIDKINDEMLKATLREGVGYLHEGLTNLDQEVVSQLFEAAVLCWGLCQHIHYSLSVLQNSTPPPPSWEEQYIHIIPKKSIAQKYNRNAYKVDPAYPRQTYKLGRNKSF